VEEVRVGKCTDRRRMVVMVILLFPFSSEGDIMIEFQVIGSVVRIRRHEEGIAPKELSWLLCGTVGPKSEADVLVLE
jgi:hypothetical protein